MSALIPNGDVGKESVNAGDDRVRAFIAGDAIAINLNGRQWDGMTVDIFRAKRNLPPPV